MPKNDRRLTFPQSWESSAWVGIVYASMQQYLHAPSVVVMKAYQLHRKLSTIMIIEMLPMQLICSHLDNCQYEVNTSILILAEKELLKMVSSFTHQDLFDFFLNCKSLVYTIERCKTFYRSCDYESNFTLSLWHIITAW